MTRVLASGLGLYAAAVVGGGPAIVMTKGSSIEAALRVALAAAALGVGCCAAGLGGGLLYDDRALVIENQDLRPQAGWASS